MISTAKYIKDIVIQDPDTGNDIDVTIFKHEGGGMFGIDASYIDQVAQEDAQGNPIINDPISYPDQPGSILLMWPKIKADAILIPVKK